LSLIFCKFGYFEARVKLPSSDSTWPAFWTLPQNDVYGPWPESGEIDIFDHKGHDNFGNRSAVHWGNSPTDL